MPVLNSIENRRSIRAYTEDPVDDEALERVLHAGLRAASAMNKQQVHFTVTRNQELLTEISKIAVESFSDQLANYKSRFADKSIFYEAPIVVVCHADRGCPSWEHGDTGIAVGNIVTQATEEGLGSCIIGLIAMGSAESHDIIKEKLQIPKEHELVCAVTLGHSKYPGKAPKIKEGRVKYI
ncbi:hypothetical protein P9112_013976 [Eukaryota sp. TZLM1-RC]